MAKEAKKPATNEGKKTSTKTEDKSILKKAVEIATNIVIIGTDSTGPRFR